MLVLKKWTPDHCVGYDVILAGKKIGGICFTQEHLRVYFNRLMVLSITLTETFKQSDRHPLLKAACLAIIEELKKSRKDEDVALYRIEESE